MLFFICTISSSFFAFDKAKLLGSGLIFFLLFIKNPRVKNVSPIELCLSAQSFLSVRVQLRASLLCQGQRLRTLALAVRIWEMEGFRRPGMEGFSWWRASLLDAFPVSLLNSCPPSHFSVCAHMCVYTSMPACVHCRATFLTGKHVYVCLQLELQESHEMEILGNYSSSSRFKLLLPNITR